MPVTIEPLDEYNFYKGYRKRLEIKLDQKNKQIARDELLLGTQSDEEDRLLKISLQQAVSERAEIQLLLDQVHMQLEKLTQPD